MDGSSRFCSPLGGIGVCASNRFQTMPTCYLSLVRKSTAIVPTQLETIRKYHFSLCTNTHVPIDRRTKFHRAFYTVIRSLISND